MHRNRVWLLAAILTLSVPLLSIQASAWEFAMDGIFTWDYDYITQTGPNGFFGPQNVDNGTTGLQTANAWLGQRAGNVLVSGSDYARNSQYMTTNMEIKINPALRIRGVYYIGSWAPIAPNRIVTPYGFTAGNTGIVGLGVGDLVASEYLNYRNPGIQRSFSPGYWNTLWLTAQLPWGTLAMGKRPSIWGIGTSWNGVENRSSEQINLTAQYGPLSIQLGLYAARGASRETGTGFNDYFNSDLDKNNLRNFDFTFPNIVYRSGPLDAGVQFNYVRTHRGAERFAHTTRAALITAQFGAPARDRENFYGGAYVKYFNGRFFLNSEFDWNFVTDRFSGRVLPTTSAQTFAPALTEGYRVAAEMGCVAGPTKLAFLYAWLGGTDRRGYGVTGTTNTGLGGINQGTFSDPFLGLYTSQSFSNTGFFRPYSYMMVYNYGLGAFFNNDTNNGYADDASIFATRLDYAVASNLNTYASFMWADRVGNAYGWGYLRPETAAFPGAGTRVVPAVTGAYRGAAGDTGNRPRAIPDNNLGWEIDTGFDWKLLEGFTASATFAYWQPGKWFNYACVDKAVPTWDVPTAANNWGVNPNRAIDPILGLEFKFTGEF